MTLGPRSRGLALTCRQGFEVGDMQPKLSRSGKDHQRFTYKRENSRPLGRADWRHSDTGTLRCLTFELSGRRRQDARPGLAKMYCVPPGRAWWPAVGAPLERGVRQRAAVVEVPAKCGRSKFGALTRRPRWRHEVMASRGDGWPALTRAGNGAWTRLWPGGVAAEGVGKKRQETSKFQRRKG